METVERQTLLSFLPIWEGVSLAFPALSFFDAFPPYMGGCIAGSEKRDLARIVSSLYGRVYRNPSVAFCFDMSFLPVWEGVSRSARQELQYYRFPPPPCMGGYVILINIGEVLCIIQTVNL